MGTIHHPHIHGVPQRIVPDNLKTAILRASFHEAQAQRAYRECAEHYGFLIDPNPPASPHLKGKVEQGGVHYVKRNFLAGRELQPLDELNRGLWRWLEHPAGTRRHGTTQQVPVEEFRTVERAALSPLPRAAYDLAVWQAATVGRDCYVTFERAYYSVPYRLVGQSVWLRGGTRTVEVYTTDHELVTTHDRATAPGERRRQDAHAPPEKLPGLLLSRASCQAEADAIGPATGGVVAALLAHRPEDRLRSAGRLLGLVPRYGRERLERACARAQRFGESGYPTIQRILAEGLDDETRTSDDAARPAPAPARFAFVRQASEFVACLLGGGR